MTAAPGWEAGEHHTVARVLVDQAARYGDKVCTWFEHEPVTYREMHERAVAAANGLLALGIGPGDSVAIFMENCPELVYTWFGAALVGAPSVPINIANRGTFLSHQLVDSGARVAVVDATLADRVLEVAGDAPELTTVLVRGDASGLAAPHGVRVGSVAELSAAPGAALSTDHEPAWDDAASILYTSGTTGPSKGVVVTQHYLVLGARSLVAAWRLRDDDVLYGPVPMFHFSGLLGIVLGPMTAGATGVLDLRFSVNRTWDRVRERGATGIVLVGAMIMMLWNLPPDPSDRELPIRLLSGAPIPGDLWHAIEERYGCEVVTMYGLTEAFPLIVKGVGTPYVAGSAGRPNPLFEVRLFDGDDREVAPGEVGEVVCRPRQPHVMFEGYHQRPDATMEQFRNLWFHTGDLGRFDEDGNFFFVDRKKDAMRRRGENISSFEVEQAVMAHGAVAEVAAHAVPSDVGEDDVKVCVVLKPGERLGPEELLDHCVKAMPYFAVPRYVEYLDDLPKNAVGRVLKYQLRERGVTPETWDREAAGYVVSR